ncbi:hypothetical protein JTB14_013246 [Gonioctena quinquepunctata]|nr:hypothetical protein JTB14_013246 [Gonioctena quinquepunctata]
MELSGGPMASNSRTLLVPEPMGNPQGFALGKLKLSWVSGHTWIPRKEKADYLFRKVTELSAIGPEPILGVSSSWAISTTRNILVNKFDDESRAAPGMR